MTPTIMVIIKVITSPFRKRRLGGRSGSCAGVFVMAMPSSPGWLHLTIGEEAPNRLDKALAALVPEEAALSRSRLMKMIDEGDVLLDGQAATNPKAKVAEGQVYALRLAPAVELEHLLAEDIPLTVIWEDADLIVIDKPAGMVVHPAPGTPSGTLVNALLAHCGDTLSGIGGERRPGIVHRIDKDTTGLLVVAKSDRAHHGLAAQFEDHSVNRRYLAVVHGQPDAYDPRLRGLRGISFEAGGILKIATHLARHKTDRQRQAVVWQEGRHAVTRARVVEDFKGAASLMECWLETGRTHQIRVHMAYAGHGLIGDQTYGGKRRLPEKLFGPAAELANSFPRQALHAATLGFEHPVTGEELEFTSPLPADMADLLAALQGGNAG
jgi:23S rRNA pseudouridine1911/1915/1917 synthase